MENTQNTQNSLILRGFIGDVELNYFDSGKALTKGYIKYTVGKVKEEWVHDYINFECWGDLAEEVNQHAIDAPNDLVTLKGKLSMDKWTDREGTTHKRPKMVAFSMETTDKERQQVQPKPTPMAQPRPRSITPGKSYQPKPKF